MREPVGMYLHFPFCVRKCNYCDFLSGPADSEVRRAYADALCREIVSFGRECDMQNKLSESEKIPVDTIFLGGGTPSAMDPADLARVMETVRGTFDVLPEAEISMEMNPGTFREEMLAFVKKYINRVSLGLQSADDSELRALGRIHTFGEFKKCFDALRDAGIANINVDLMSAIPGQTLASWEKSLERVLGMKPEHISCYSLIIEEGTPFYDLYESGRLALPDEDEEREMYYLTERFMNAHGYHRYEISNYARTGYECRHNVRYWTRAPYVGFGIGAASLNDEIRWSNTRDLQRYLGCNGNLHDIREDVHALSVREQMEEFMFLGLRMMEGVSERIFAESFGCGLSDIFGDTCDRLIKEGLLARDGDRVMLTARGIDISNVVLAEFLF